MEIDDTINKWFDDSKSLLQELNLPKCKIDIMILSTISLIDNYLNNALLILNGGSRLPAMALLRVMGEFISKITYCLKGKNQKEVENRIGRWEKSSLIQRRELYKKILSRYKKPNSQVQFKKVQEWINETEDEIKKIKSHGLPQNQDIFLEAFGEHHPVGQDGIYHQYHCSIHVDLETLARTIRNNEYTGDFEFNIEDLKFECLTHAYFYLKEIYEYYELNTQIINDDYDRLLQRILKRINS